MSEYLKVLLVGLFLSVAGAVLAVQAAEAATAQIRTKAPVVASENAPVSPKAATCRLKWPYVMLSCVA